MESSSFTSYLSSKISFISALLKSFMSMVLLFLMSTERLHSPVSILFKNLSAYKMAILGFRFLSPSSCAVLTKHCPIIFCLLGSVDINKQSAGTVSSSFTTIMSPTIILSVRTLTIVSILEFLPHYILNEGSALVFLSSCHLLISLIASRSIPKIMRPARGGTEKNHSLVETWGIDCRIMLIR